MMSQTTGDTKMNTVRMDTTYPEMRHRMREREAKGLQHHLVNKVSQHPLRRIVLSFTETRNKERSALEGIGS